MWKFDHANCSRVSVLSHRGGVLLSRAGTSDMKWLGHVLEDLIEFGEHHRRIDYGL